MECFDALSWYVEEGESQGKERMQCEKQRDTRERRIKRNKKKRRLHNLSEEPSHDLNIAGIKYAHAAGILLPVKPAASAVWAACINGVLYRRVVIILCCLMGDGAAAVTLLGKVRHNLCILEAERTVKSSLSCSNLSWNALKYHRQRVLHQHHSNIQNTLRL